MSTSGGINKLEAYKRLDISEVCFWGNGVLEIYHLRGKDESLHYERILQSEALSGIDMELLAQCITMTNHVDAVKRFQQSLLN
ncbi:MAG: hypothetical protein VKL39_15310 [Leptolyngbyaceae bacterium]|nr:hypothetical protein [Leptolyngbyaceae bacterium]